MSGYTKTGPFNASLAPGISAAFLNAVENYLNPATAKNGVPNISWFGPCAVTTTLTAFSHNLVTADGTATHQIPDVIFLSIAGNSSTTAHNAYWDNTTLSSTQVKIIGDGNLTVYGIALKF